MIYYRWRRNSIYFQRTHTQRIARFVLLLCSLPCKKNFEKCFISKITLQKEGGRLSHSDFIVLILPSYSWTAAPEPDQIQVPGRSCTATDKKKVKHKEKANTSSHNKKVGCFSLEIQKLFTGPKLTLNTLALMLVQNRNIVISES